MDQDLLKSGFQIERSRQERRVAAHREPPYVTEEGLVLYDRREGGDRRRVDQAGVAIEPARAPDLVAQRMQHLAAMYGYVSAQARAQAEVAKQLGSDWYRPTTKRSANGV